MRPSAHEYLHHILDETAYIMTSSRPGRRRTHRRLGTIAVCRRTGAGPVSRHGDLLRQPKSLGGLEGRLSASDALVAASTLSKGLRKNLKNLHFLLAIRI
jgi:hypothetical protein